MQTRWLYERYGVSQRDTQHEGDAQLQAKVELAKVKVPVRDFENLEEGQVLFFKKPDYARLIVNDVPIFETSVGTHGTQVAIKIENPIKPEESND